jgi:uncharacterized membrane protein
MLPGAVSMSADDINEDGSVIVGSAFLVVPEETARAHRCTSSGGMQNLGLLSPGDSGSSAFGVNGDGSVVAGFSGTSAVIWNGGVAQDIGMLPGATNVIAYTLSDDGSLVGGYSFFDFSPRATPWSQAMGTVDSCREGVEGNKYLTSICKAASAARPRP